MRPNSKVESDMVLPTDSENLIRVAQEMRHYGMFIFQRFGGLTPHPCTDGGKIWRGRVDRI